MRPRLIPVLSLDSRRRVVKTIGFDTRTYIGDPFNVLRLFNEKAVDEIVVLDIDATTDGRSPDPGFIAELASECFIPLAYGGGLQDMATCETLARLGVEKFVVGTAATQLGFIAAMSRCFGAQAVVGCVDARGAGLMAQAVVRSGRQPLQVSALDHAKWQQDAGCGEIILQSVDRDGTRSGYDIELISAMSHSLSVPLIALGGAGGRNHLFEALAAGASASASASAFSFYGKLRAVLVNYPSAEDVNHMTEQLAQLQGLKPRQEIA